MHISDLTIKKFHKGLVNREFSAFEAAKEFYSYIEEKDKSIGAFLQLTKDLAFEQASEVDVKLAKGESIGVLAGAPVAIKDNILIEGLATTSASKILEKYEASYDATVIKKLREARAVFLGKANMDEFAMGSSTENSAYQITRNPYDPERVPGGSSGGSAAAVGSGMALAALGSDTGGSIRQPASFCGVVGLKPTYGAVSRYGLMAMASSLDQIGPIAKTVEDAQILFDAIKGKDILDSTSTDLNKYAAGQDLSVKDLANITIGLPKEYFIEGLDKEVAGEVGKAVEAFKKMGVKIKEISLPHTKYALSCYYIIMPAEVSSNLARFDGIRYSRVEDGKSGLKEIYLKNKGAGFGAEVQRRIILGTFVLSSGYYDAYYSKAQKVRRLIKQDFDGAFKEVDVILTPVSPTAPFKIGEKTDDPLNMYLSDIFTIPLNLAGLPGISIPVRNYDKEKSELPHGFQLIARAFDEDVILSMGKHYESRA